jgi:formate dehydrogenase major subunit
MDYKHPSSIMDEIAALTPTFTGVTYEKIDSSVDQWPCNASAPDGTPTMHVGSSYEAKGKFYVTPTCPPASAAPSKYPLL